jgi:hypothetical protein
MAPAATSRAGRSRLDDSNDEVAAMKKECSAKQLEANKKNSLKSTGPRSVAGKMQSRKNGIKHGLTGQGIVIHTEDAEVLEQKIQSYKAELKPNGQFAMDLVCKLALCSVRFERCARHEAKSTAYRQRHAIRQFEDARLAEAEKLMMYIATAPATNARRLRTTPEGIDLLIEGFRGLGHDLNNERGPIWDYHHCDKILYLTGRTVHVLPITRHQALSEAMMGDFRNLNEHAEGPAPEGLSKEERTFWCADELIDLINVEIIKLQELKKNLNLEDLELDRAEAAERAIIGTSDEEILVRKYAGAIDRCFSRTLREFNQIQVEIPAPLPPPIAEPDEEEMGSSLPEVPEEEDEEIEEETVDPTDESPPENDVPPTPIVAEGPSEVAREGECIDDR